MENISRHQRDPHADPVTRAERAIARMQMLNREIARLESQISDSLVTVFESAEELRDQQAPGSGSSLELILRGLLMDASLQLNISDRALETRLNWALDISSRFPKTGALFEEGLLSLRVATVIAQEGTSLEDPTDLARYDREVSQMALQAGMTPWAIKKKAKELVASLTLETFGERREEDLAYFQAAGLKQVEISDGVVENRFVTSAIDAQILKTRFQKIAKLKQQEPEEQRNIGQLETETIMELLTGGLDEKYVGVRAEVSILIPTENVLTQKKINSPVILEDYGPIPFDETVKTIFEDANVWRKIFVNDESGLVAGVESYQPSVEQKKYLKARDRRCRWSGCGAKLGKTDIDHTTPWSEGGKTQVTNLAHLCRRHHTAKHHSGWKLKQKTSGLLEWTSPTGKTYKDHPDPYPVKQKHKLKLKLDFLEAPNFTVRLEPSHPPPF